MRFGPTDNTLDALSLFLARYKRLVLNPLQGENNIHIHQQLDWLEEAETSVEEIKDPSKCTGYISDRDVKRSLRRMYF